MDLKNKHILITGGSKGIGQELIKILLEKGSHVYNISRSAPPFKHDNLITHQADLSDTIPEFKGNFDIVILNLGTNPGVKPFENFTADEIERTIQLNVNIHLKILNNLKKSLSGRKKSDENPVKIVFVNSVLSMVAMPENALYCACKAFISSFNQSLRREGWDTYIVYPYKVNTTLFNEIRDIFPLDKKYVAKTIVKDIESGRKERVLPLVFSLIPVLNSILPIFFLDFLVLITMKIFIKPKMN